MTKSRASQSFTIFLLILMNAKVLMSEPTLYFKLFLCLLSLFAHSITRHQHKRRFLREVLLPIIFCYVCCKTDDSPACWQLLSYSIIKQGADYRINKTLFHLLYSNDKTKDGLIMYSWFYLMKAVMFVENIGTVFKYKDEAENFK